jgi:hypothetical protein
MKPLWFDGVDPSNDNSGIAYYGRTYKLSDPSCDKMGCRFISGQGGAAGSCTAFPGVLSNREIKRPVNCHATHCIYRQIGAEAGRILVLNIIRCLGRLQCPDTLCCVYLLYTCTQPGNVASYFSSTSSSSKSFPVVISNRECWGFDVALPEQVLKLLSVWRIVVVRLKRLVTSSYEPASMGLLETSTPAVRLEKEWKLISRTMPYLDGAGL